MFRHCAWAALALVFFPGTAVSAAGQATAELGSRVRVTVPAQGLRRAEGTLQDTAGGSLVVVMQETHEVRAFDLESVTRLDVLAGTKRPILKDGGIGLLTGAVMGGFIGLTSGDDECSGWCIMTFTAEEKAAMFGALFGVIGGLTGLVIGATQHVDAWKRVAVPSRPQGVTRSVQRPTLSPIVGAGGVGVKVSVPIGTW